MRIFRYAFILCGDELDSVALVSKPEGNYTICRQEEIGRAADTQGAISIAPPFEAVVDEDQEQVNMYHAWFASLLEANYHVFAECGANDLRIFMEMFYAQGQQCNLEVFDRETISIIGRFNVTLPISIYTLSEESLAERAKAIKIKYSPD